MTIRIYSNSNGNSADKLCHPRSVAYSVELVILSKRQILGSGACLHCYLSTIQK